MIFHKIQIYLIYEMSKIYEVRTPEKLNEILSTVLIPVVYYIYIYIYIKRQ
jgi:hypothetical protein